LPPFAALFLDFDGTLAPIAPRPQDVRVPSWLIPTLARLQQGLQGALAIVSGRPLSQIDELLQPLRLQAAGTHGAERRDAGGRIEVRKSEPPAAMVAVARDVAARYHGLIFEMKPSAFALHFRQRPDLEALCRDALAHALRKDTDAAVDWELLPGHFVVELKPRAVSKGQAVQAYLTEPMFAARLPVFVGDDCADESGMRAAQAAGGFGVRVGPGQTQAHYRLADTDAVAVWLQAGARSAWSGEQEHAAP
jgi:trehalose 6-phosphate phosphatase